MVWDVAKARAPAFGVKSRSAMARSIRRRVSAEIDRLPESAYETVLRATPARLATSSMVAILAHPLIVEAVRFPQLLAQPLSVVKGWSEWAVFLHTDNHDAWAAASERGVRSPGSPATDPKASDVAEAASSTASSTHDAPVSCRSRAISVRCL